jgi:predicted ester cyclase
MTRSEILELFERRHEALARGDSSTLAGLYAEGGVVESPTAGGSVTGRKAIEQVYQAWFRAFPDLVFSSDELLIDGNRVAEIATITGTDTGGFMGLPPTAKPFKVPILILCTVEGNQIVHERRIYDFTGMLVQIGVLKARPA